MLAVGFSQGAFFALALGEHHLVQAIALVSRQDELSQPALKPLLHPDVAGMIAAVQQKPVEFEQHFAEIATAEGLWQLILGMSGTGDRALHESEPFSTA